jgi:hypothetical protein
LQAGAWLDTQFDATAIQSEAIAFGSARYFQFLSQHPETGPYLALGERITLVLDGRAYAIGPDGQSQAAPMTQPIAESTAQPTAALLHQSNSRTEATAPAVSAGTAEPGRAANRPLALAQATPAAAGATSATAPMTLPPCVAVPGMVGLAAALPFWCRWRARGQ